MNASRTARDRARAELTREIADTARRQLAEAGADGLSLRAVARELGLASSALYRYFPSRDDLLTVLIIDAYNALGAVAEAAVTGTGGYRDRWRTVCRAVRAWAVEHPHEYALIYGSPVPGYTAPSDTIAPASRVPLAMAGLLREAGAAGALTEVDAAPAPKSLLARQIADLAEALGGGLPPAVVTRALISWTQLFGMINFELFGQFVGSVDPSDEFFEHVTAMMATFVGLP